MFTVGKHNKPRFHSYSTTNKMHLFLKLFILVKHSTFQTVFPFIIMSWKLHIRQQTYVKQLLLVGTKWNSVPFRPR